MNYKLMSIRDAFGKKLAELCSTHSEVVALDGDLGNSTKLSAVEQREPLSFLQMGIAEQNMVGVAAGLASVGFQPWVCSFATFLTKRAYDQIVVSVDQPSFDVKLVGAYSGLLTSNTGKTHHALDDIALMSLLPNMTVLAPADPVETVLAMEAAYEWKGPVYIRLTRDDSIPTFTQPYPFEIGKGKVVQVGSDISLLSTGSVSYRAREVCDQLNQMGISVYHLHLPTIKPIDEEAILHAAAATKQMVTLEEHYIRGGLGSIVSEILCEQHPMKVTRIGVNNRYASCGKNEDLLREHGLSVNTIVEKIKSKI